MLTVNWGKNVKTVNIGCLKRMGFMREFLPLWRNRKGIFKNPIH